MTANLSKIGMGRDGGLYYIDDPAREATAAVQPRDDYYTRDGGGIWRSTGGTIVRDGSIIDRRTFQDLCAGIHPGTGSPAVRGAGAQHRAGWDLTLACPKSMSLLWATGTVEQRGMLERLQKEAVGEALQLLDWEALLEVRSGAGGHSRARPTDVIIGQFQHYTSREGDPHLHIHNVIINVAGCTDSKTRTLEPERLYDAQHLIGAGFRAALAQRLVAEGFVLRSAGRGQFEIAGFPAQCLQAFSKRSAQIENVVDRNASAAQKQLATLQTRRSKMALPGPDDLLRDWQEELARLGIDPWQAVIAPTPGLEVEPLLAMENNRERMLDPPEVAGSGPVAISASLLLRTQSVITRTTLLTAAFREASLRGLGIGAVYAELEELERDGILTRLDDERIGRTAMPDLGAAWTTPAIAACEACMLRATIRPAERVWFDLAKVRAALGAAIHLSQEQREAVELTASEDGVCLIEAGAGTGKTTLARVLVQAAEASKLTVLALAPSWVAADEIAASTGIAAQAIAKWRSDLVRGTGRPLDADTVILVDEAGMVGTRDMEAILSSAVEKGCKVVLLGDRRQLASVPGANALGAISDLLQRQGSLTDVRRQAVPWQRAASTVMARGDSEAGLRTYARHGRVNLVQGEEAARAEAIRGWSEFRRQHGEETLMVTRRNSDATLLNHAAREVLRSEGQLTSPDVYLPSINRKKLQVDISLAIGDRIRFGETLPNFGIRNGTRATVQGLRPVGNGNFQVSFALDDGRVVADWWSAFSRSRIGQSPDAPRISHAYAGTAYAAQGRTVPAAVLYLSQASDAREVYVGLTRHVHDARIVVERSRLDAAVRARQADPRVDPTDVAMLQSLCVEAQRYAEKENVIDYLEDRAAFIATGVVSVPTPAPALDLSKAVRAAAEIAREEVDREKLFNRAVVGRLILRMQDRLSNPAQPVEKRIRLLLQRPKLEIEIDREAALEHPPPAHER